MRIIVPFPPGGSNDIVARHLAETLRERHGQPFLVENRAGAGANIGADLVAKSPADGHTLLLAAPGPFAINQHLYRSMPFDPVRDLVPVALVAEVPIVLMVPMTSPATTLTALIALARRQPGRLSFGSSSIGGTNHLAGELLKGLANLQFTIVPYRTAALAVQDLVAGRMQLTVDSPMMLAPLIREGRLRGLAVSGSERSDLLPGLPTLMESGVPGYELTAWQVLFVRPGTPPEATAILSDAARRAVADPGVQARLRQNASEVWPDTSPEAAAAFVRGQVERWVPIVRQLGISN